MKPLDTDYDCNCKGKDMVPQEPQEKLYCFLFIFRVLLTEESLVSTLKLSRFLL